MRPFAYGTSSGFSALRYISGAREAESIARRHRSAEEPIRWVYVRQVNPGSA